MSSLTMRGRAQPDEEPVHPAKLDGWSMAYQLTSLGISVLALLRERPMHGYEMFQTLVQRDADRIVKVRPGSLYHVAERLTEEELIRRAATARVGKRPERAIYEITDAGVTPDGYLVALDYLLTMMQTELSWLREFAGSLRSGQLEWRQAASDSKVRSQDEVRI